VALGALQVPDLCDRSLRNYNDPGEIEQRRAGFKENGLMNPVTTAPLNSDQDFFLRVFGVMQPHIRPFNEK
jgi:hypothetical protein